MSHTPFLAHRNRLFVTLAVLFMALVFFPGQRLMADDTEQIIRDLEQDARENIDQKDYAVARDKLEAIVQQYPTAIISQGGVIKTSIFLKDLTRAQTETNKLLTDFASHPEVARIVREVADCYRIVAKLDAKAIQLYQTTLNTWPKASDLIWCYRGLAISQIQQENFTAADAAADTLLSNYSDHPDFAKVAPKVAGIYLRFRRYPKAIQLYQAVVNKGAEATDMIGSLRDLARIHIQQADFEAAEPMVDRLLSDYSNDSGFLAAVRQIAGHYHSAKQYAKAALLYQTAIDNGGGIQCVRGLACSKIRQEDFAAAQTAAGTLVSTYSSDPGFAKAVRDVANSYLIEEKYAQAAQYYETAINAKPSSADMVGCLRDLARSRIVLGDFEAAQAAVDTLLSQYATEPAAIGAIRQIAGFYRRAKQYTEAEQLYQTVVNNGSKGVDMMWSQRGLARLQIRQKDYAAADATISTLIADYSSSPDMAKAVREVADCYRVTGKKYSKALQLYQTALNAESDSANRILCLQGMACSQIKLRDLEAADATVSTLLSEYSTHSSIALVLRQVAEHYRNAAKEYGKAAQLYQTAIDKGGDILCLRGLACSQIGQADMTAADATVNKLLADYVDNPDLAKTVREVADCYLKSHKQDQALETYQKALELNPSKREQNNAHAGLARIYIMQGNESVAQSKIALILNNYDVDSDATMGIFVIGEQYYLQAQDYLKQKNLAQAQTYYQKAITVWDNNISRIIEPIYQCEACYYSAIAYQHVNDYEKAIDYYKQVIQFWPECEWIEGALLSCGKCYCELYARNKTLPENADIILEGIVNMLVSMNPEADITKMTWTLGTIKYHQSQWDDAVTYLELYLMQEPDEVSVSNAYYLLGQAYANINQNQQALRYCLKYLDAEAGHNPKRLMQTQKQIQRLQQKLQDG